MIFTRTEIEVLRLCAWCKDLPTGSAEILPENTIRLLLILGLIRKSRCGLSYRITSKGNAVLQAAGFFYEPDKQYLGKSQALIRRLCLASLTSFFWRIGADVFSVMLREKDWTTYFFLLSRCAERFLLTFSEVRGWLVFTIREIRRSFHTALCRTTMVYTRRQNKGFSSRRP